MKRERQSQQASFRQLASQAQRRYLDRGISRADEIANIRAKTTENLCRAIYETLTGVFGVSEDDYDEMARTVDGYSRQYRTISEKHGPGEAGKWLSELCGAQKCADFVLPIDKTPKKARDWHDLACKRSAGLLVAKLYACGMKKSMKMDDQKIDFALEAAKERYRQLSTV